MAVIVVDSDVLIDALRGQASAAERIRRGIETRGIATTAINAFELESGARTSQERDKITTLLAAFTVLPVDEAASRAAASVRRDLESSGTGIGLADYLIAGVCLARRCKLLTRNREHFRRVRGLSLVSLDPRN